ncbi:MAG: hypothetical protein AAF703_15660 [Cyanobacteria bacterium P01_D01_bin.105]
MVAWPADRNFRLTWCVAAMWLMGCDLDRTWMPMSWRTSGERLAAIETAGLMEAIAERGSHSAYMRSKCYLQMHQAAASP